MIERELESKSETDFKEKKIEMRDKDAHSRLGADFNTRERSWHRFVSPREAELYAFSFIFLLLNNI